MMITIWMTPSRDCVPSTFSCPPPQRHNHPNCFFLVLYELPSPNKETIEISRRNRRPMNEKNNTHIFFCFVFFFFNFDAAQIVFLNSRVFFKGITDVSTGVKFLPLFSFCVKFISFFLLLLFVLGIETRPVHFTFRFSFWPLFFWFFDSFVIQLFHEFLRTGKKGKKLKRDGRVFFFSYHFVNFNLKMILLLLKLQWNTMSSGRHKVPFNGSTHLFWDWCCYCYDDVSSACVTESECKEWYNVNNNSRRTVKKHLAIIKKH